MRTIRSWPLVAAASLFVSACGGGGGGGEDKPFVPSSPTISGGVVKGPTQGSTVCAYAISAGAKGARLALTASSGAVSDGCFVTGADGAYSFTLPADTIGDVLLEAAGGSFCSNEAQVFAGACPAGATLVNLGSSVLKALANAGTDAAATVYVTPLTTAAVNAAGTSLSASTFRSRYTALAGQVIGTGTAVTPATPPNGTNQPYLTQVSTFLAGGGTLTTAVSALERGMTPTLDARNGEYAAYAGDARKYTLALNFDSARYSISNGTTTVAGAFTAAGADYVFAPLPGSAAPVNNARFSIANGMVIGGIDLGGGVLPFVASRSFATSLAEAAGTYNFLSVTLDGGEPNTAIQSGRLTADGQLSFCNDNIIYRIDLCPAGSLGTGTVTLADDEFTSNTSAGAFAFRVVRIGSDRIFLRASASTGGSRRLVIGTLLAPYEPGTFAAVDSRGSRGTLTVAPPGFSQGLATTAGGADSLAGSAVDMAGGPNSPAGIVGISTPAGGAFFAVRSPSIHILVAARSSVTRPLYLQIGKPQ